MGQVIISRHWVQILYLFLGKGEGNEIIAGLLLDCALSFRSVCGHLISIRNLLFGQQVVVFMLVRDIFQLEFQGLSVGFEQISVMVPY